MGKNRQIESVESRINRTNNNKNYTQVVLTAPAKICVGKYLTKKGKRLMALATTEKEKAAIRRKYEKKRYIPNPDCDVFRNELGKIRRIKHT